MTAFRPLVLALTGTNDFTDLASTAVMAVGVSLGVSLFLLTAIRLSRSNPSLPAIPPVPETHSYTVENGQLRPESAAARVFLESLGESQAGDAGQTATLVTASPDLARALDALESGGTPFRSEIAVSDDLALEVTGGPSGSLARVRIGKLTEERRSLLEVKNRLHQASQRSGELLAALDDAPVAAWLIDAEGAVEWSNAGFRNLASDAGSAQDLVACLDQENRADGETAAPVRVELAAVSGKRTFDVFRRASASGRIFGFAADITPLVEAEAALARFVETLTVTFAHLPTGLAIFDKDRRLGMFNPALADLLKLEPPWLARGPSLRDFLEHLRENRQMPDQKDFISWRRRLTDLEEGAKNGSYDEIWVLPSGRNLRVSGRPHPQGALAFLFEDISDAVRLEARRRSDNALNQALMDRLSEAIGVFGANGRLNFFNAAFGKMWNLDAEVAETARNVVGMTNYWAALGHDEKLFARLRNFATSGEEREAWTARARLRDNRAVDCAFAPLPDSSTLVVFTMADGGVRQATAPAGADREEEEMNGENTNGVGRFFDGLEDILLPRGTRLETDAWRSGRQDPLGTRTLRRIAWNMVLAAVELAPGAAEISIGCETAGGRTTVRARPRGAAMTANGDDGTGGIALRVLRHFVAGQNGELVIERAGVPELVCRLPNSPGVEDSTATPSATAAGS